MTNSIEKIIKYSIYVALGLLLIINLLDSIDSIEEFFSAMNKVIIGTLFIIGIYSKWLWVWNPFEKTPKIKGIYTGKIYFEFDGKKGEKDASIIIKQTLFTTNVQVKTNEIISNTIVSNLIEENSQYILYYTYMTTPNSAVSHQNPIQLGTCRLQVLDDGLGGNYWTTQKTLGDVFFKKDTLSDMSNNDTNGLQN